MEQGKKLGSTHLLIGLLSMDGSAALKLSMLCRLRAAHMLDHEDPLEVAKAEDVLRTLAMLETKASAGEL